MAEPPAARAWKGGRVVASNDGAWSIVYQLAHDPIERGETFSIDVWVFAPDALDTPRTDVQLSVDAAMPQHGHGMNRVPKVEARADGRFRAEGLLFHMPGKWELYFDITSGPVTERAQTDVLLE